MPGWSRDPWCRRSRAALPASAGRPRLRCTRAHCQMALGNTWLGRRRGCRRTLSSLWCPIMSWLGPVGAVFREDIVVRAPLLCRLFVLGLAIIALCCIALSGNVWTELRSCHLRSQGAHTLSLSLRMASFPVHSVGHGWSPTPARRTPESDTPPATAAAPPLSAKGATTASVPPLLAEVVAAVDAEYWGPPVSAATGPEAPCNVSDGSVLNERTRRAPVMSGCRAGMLGTGALPWYGARMQL